MQVIMQVIQVVIMQVIRVIYFFSKWFPDRSESNDCKQLSMMVTNMPISNEQNKVKIIALIKNANYYFLSGDYVRAYASYLCAATLFESSVGNNQEQYGPIYRCLANSIKESHLKVKAIVAKASSGGNNADDEGRDWKSICTQLQPIVFKGDNCLFFSDVIGLHPQKEQIKSAFIFPLLYPNLYPKVSKGVLLYGPPGTGKTFIVRSAVTELQKIAQNKVGVLYFAPSPGDLKGKYVGETEKNIEKYFECASRAACEQDRACKSKGIPRKHISVIFMDEMDAIAPNRDNDTTGLAANSVNTLLQMMDGIGSKPNVSVIAATNYPWNLDSAIIRRFDTQIIIDVGNKNDLIELLKMEVRNSLKIKSESTFCQDQLEREKDREEKNVIDFWN